MVNTDLRFKVTIDLSKINVNGATNPNYRVITLEDTTNYSSLGIPLSQLSGIFIVKDPLNNTIHQGTFTSPDIVQGISTEFSGVNIPLESYNQPLNGEYTFQMIVRNTYDDYNNQYTDYQTSAVKVDVCNNCTKGEVELTFDCNRGYAYGKDLTKYKSNASVSRILTLAPPIGAKYIDGSDATPFQTTSKNIQSNALWTQTWQLLLRSVFIESGSKDVLTYQIIGSVEVRKDAQATCNINLCSLFTCFDKKIVELERKASRLGGITNSHIGEEMVQLTNAYMQLQGARECGDGARAQKYYDLLKSMLDCDCGCGNSNMPEYVYPLVPPPGDSTIVEGSQYIAVTGNTVGNTTTYTVAISSVLSNLIQLIKTYDIKSGDDTISVSKTVDGTSVLFDIKVNTEEVDYILGQEVDSKSIGGDTLTEIVQNLVDLADEGGEPPVAEPDIATTIVDNPINVLVTANDFYSSNVVVTIKTTPNNGTASVGTDGKTITYTPDSAWTGTEVLTYTITDAQGRTSDATLTIIVDSTPGVSCATITAQFVASLSVQSGKIQVALTNLTNYLTNIPNTNAYVIEVRDSSNNVLYTHNVTGNNNSIGQVFTIPETPDSTWNNIRVTQTVTSKNNVGASCGTVTSFNSYTMPDVSSSIFAGITVNCLGVTNADPDTVIMQALVDKACSATPSIINVTVLANMNGHGDQSYYLTDYLSIPNGWYFSETPASPNPEGYISANQDNANQGGDTNIQIESDTGEMLFSADESVASIVNTNPTDSANRTIKTHGFFWVYMTNGLQSRRVNITVVNNAYKSWIVEEFEVGDESEVFGNTDFALGVGVCRRIWKIENNTLKVKWTIIGLYKTGSQDLKLKLPIQVSTNQSNTTPIYQNCGTYIKNRSSVVSTNSFGNNIVSFINFSDDTTTIWAIDTDDNKLNSDFLETSTNANQMINVDIEIPLLKEF